MLNPEHSKSTKKLLQRQQSMARIIDGAITVFMKKGYENANIVEITREAGVATGSLNNCFGNKERLGAYVTYAMLRHTMPPVREMVSFDDDPILFTLASVCTYHRFMMETGGYRQFFLDALKYDFIFNYLTHIPNNLAENLIRHYRREADQEAVTLTSQYLPYMLGRTLILKQQEGYFNGIASDEVAFLMCREALKDFVPEAEIRARSQEGLRIAREICDRLSQRPSMETIESAVQISI